MEGSAEAARILRKAGWQPAMTEKQLLSMREEVSSRPKGDPMRDTYDLMLGSAVAKAHPLQWAKMLASHGWVNRPAEGQSELSR